MTTSIGSLTNVPAAGDPIASQWARDVSTLGVHPFASKAALDAAWGSAPNGAWAWTIDTKIVWVRVAGAWVTYQQRGSGTLTWSASAQSALLTVTFPYAFPVTPITMVTCGNITGNTPVAAGINVSSTAVAILARTISGGSYSGTAGVHWQATLA